MNATAASSATCTPRIVGRHYYKKGKDHQSGPVFHRNYHIFGFTVNADLPGKFSRRQKSPHSKHYRNRSFGDKLHTYTQSSTPSTTETCCRFTSDYINTVKPERRHRRRQTGVAPSTPQEALSFSGTHFRSGEIHPGPLRPEDKAAINGTYLKGQRVNGFNSHVCRLAPFRSWQNSIMLRTRKSRSRRRRREPLTIATIFSYRP